MTTWDHVQAYIAAGLSIIPIRTDGSKAPIGDWKQRQTERITLDEAQGIWDKRKPPGVAVICGAVSGNLEVLDFDAPGAFDSWKEIVDQDAPGLLDALPVHKTPKGFGRHVFITREFPPAPSQKLARKIRDGEDILMIETKGEAGYIILPGSPRGAHPSGNTYEHAWGPELGDVDERRPITDAEYEVLISAAKALNEVADPRPAEERGTGTAYDPDVGVDTTTDDGILGVRPGTRYASQTSWTEIMEGAGWTFGRDMVHEGRPFKTWYRPGGGKDSPHATTGRVSSNYTPGEDLLYVWGERCPIPVGSYGKFKAYAWLHHKGDYSAAARHIVKNFPLEPEEALPDELAEAFTQEWAELQRQPRTEPVLETQYNQKLRAAKQNQPSVQQLWKHTRRDFESEDADRKNGRYLTALVRLLGHHHFAARATAQALHDWFLSRTDPGGFAGVTADMVLDRIAWLRRHPLLSEDDAVRKYEHETSIKEAVPESGDEEADAERKRKYHLAEASKLLGLVDAAGEPQIRRFYSTIATEGLYFLEVEGIDRPVSLGPIDNVTSFARFSNRLRDRISRRIPEASRAKMEWASCQDHLFAVREVEDPVNEAFLEKVQGYLDYDGGNTCVDDLSPEDELSDGKATRMLKREPFTSEGRVYIHLGEFQKWLQMSRDETRTQDDIVKLMKEAGFSRGQLYTPTPDGFARVRYWSVAAGLL